MKAKTKISVQISMTSKDCSNLVSFIQDSLRNRVELNEPAQTAETFLRLLQNPLNLSK